MARERYFLNRHTGKVYVDRHFPERFTHEPERYRELEPDEYAALTAVSAQFLDSMKPWTGRHRGETIHIFGNGPSLLEFAAKQDWSGRLTLGVNAAGLHIRPLRYWISVDNLAGSGQRDLYDWIQRWLESLRGRTITFARFGAPLCQRGLRAAGVSGSPWLPDAMFPHAAAGPVEHPQDGLYWNASSVQAALDLARHFGCRRAVLWGVDYHDRSHAYTGSLAIAGDAGDQPGRPWAHWAYIVRGFEVLREACAEREVQVFNANPRSRLTVFPFLAPQAAWGVGTIGESRRPDAGATTGHPEAATPAPAQDTLLFIFFTTDTSYEVLARAGVAAFAEFGLEVRATPYPNSGDWMTNALGRAPRLAALAEEHAARTVGLLDAELRPLRRPDRLFCFHGDFAVEDRGPDRPPHDRYSAGVLLFGPTPLGRLLLRNWAARCHADPEPGRTLREQKYLHDCIEELRPRGLQVTELGNAYNRLPEQRRQDDDTVLLHAPASRRTLAEIGGRR